MFGFNSSAIGISSSCPSGTSSIFGQSNDATSNPSVSKPSNFSSSLGFDSSLCGTMLSGFLWTAQASTPAFSTSSAPSFESSMPAFRFSSTPSSGAESTTPIFGSQASSETCFPDQYGRIRITGKKLGGSKVAAYNQTNMDGGTCQQPLGDEGGPESTTPIFGKQASSETCLPDQYGRIRITGKKLGGSKVAAYTQTNVDGGTCQKPLGEKGGAQSTTPIVGSQASGETCFPDQYGRIRITRKKLRDSKVAANTQTNVDGNTCQPLGDKGGLLLSNWTLPKSNSACQDVVRDSLLNTVKKLLELKPEEYYVLEEVSNSILDLARRTDLDVSGLKEPLCELFGASRGYAKEVTVKEEVFVQRDFEGVLVKMMEYLKSSRDNRESVKQLHETTSRSAEETKSALEFAEKNLSQLKEEIRQLQMKALQHEADIREKKAALDTSLHKLAASNDHLDLLTLQVTIYEEWLNWLYKDLNHALSSSEIRQEAKREALKGLAEEIGAKLDVIMKKVGL